MPIEVRELLIRSQVEGSASAPSGRRTAGETLDVRQLEQFRQALLAECEALVAAAVRRQQER